VSEYVYFCDDCDLKSSEDAPVQNVLVLGGFRVARSAVPALLAAVAATKQKIVGDPHVPIKWNLKDLTQVKAANSELFKKVMSESDSIRSALVDVLLAHEVTIITSAVEAKSKTKSVINEKRDELKGFTFANILMQLGLISRAQPTSGTQLVLDWPHSNKRAPFDDQYAEGWLHGKTVSSGFSGPKYLSGPLSTLGFEQGLLFGSCMSNAGIQLADLVVGATKSFAIACLNGGSKNTFGVDQFKKLYPRLHGAPAHPEWGLVVTPKTCALAAGVKAGLKAVRKAVA